MAKKDKKDKAAEPQSTTSSGGDYGLEGPGSGGNFTAKELKDELLLITPLELVEDMATTFGTSDAVRADIVVLNRKKPADSETIDGGLIFQKVLIGQLREPMQKKKRVVGTLIEDIASQKKGQSAPYRLTAPSDEDLGVARAYLDSLDPLR